MIYITLFFSFARIGLLTVGGGFAMLPLIQAEAVTHYEWITLQEFTDIIAVAQVTPGAVGINSATYIGYKAAGFLGGLSASLGLVAPSLVIVMIVAGFLLKFQDNIWRKRIFSGIRPVAAALIASAVFVIARMVMFPDGLRSFRLIPAIISVLSFLILRNPWKKIHPIIVLGLCAVAGIIFL
ncbi:MAG: chromate transporter [Spirochaetales bacterium]|nr:chromate transporter [Spirochaetales bacterium]